MASSELRQIVAIKTQAWELSILGRKNRLIDRPRNVDGRIVPDDSVLVIRCIEVSAFVLHLGNVGSDAVAMSEACRYEQLPLVLCRQFHTDPTPKVRRAPADIHRDVKNGSTDSPQQLSLGPQQLIMQPADRPARRARMVVLDERRNAGAPITVRMVGLEEETARVSEHSRLDDHDAGKLRGDDVH